ncbi:macro domain-containing protein [candidate division KSB1 bacterium]|nr:macro domain-containing protein [candidate division KSB1 bacterium]
MEKCKVNQSVISLVLGDITEQTTDAIVNAANSQLVLGAGVAGAIRSKGGPTIQQECDKIGGTPVGTAVITTGGNLSARFVIHAVGPMMGEGDEYPKLAGATRSSLEVALENKLKSLTFPAISTGIFGFPIDRCADIMLGETKKFLHEHTQLQEVRFCLWDKNAYEVFFKALA